ncbi:hypothetical protein CROQUDRAFT_47226 [Cronartium quercuum f. sp. fusiforme G11]|uniref:DUF7872 domain-containing protein n=1 Tax=Cronartium quercuum f. sp. fusiforme G11 TaxID=708437 RepID=A0A9P6ND20_9BASI|nr:hypothetical protein CROQUDRAFT_47226 [Cronartium quercuum f. sp. fusiforme G11]
MRNFTFIKLSLAFVYVGYPLPDGTWPKIVKVEKMEPKLWEKYNVTGWLETYPEGKNKTVRQFARENGVYNFDCRVSQSCHIGQIGQVPGPLYYPLFSLENYSKVQTSIIKAAGFAAKMVQTIGSQLAIDLYVNETSHLFILYLFPTHLFLTVLQTTSCFHIIDLINPILSAGALMLVAGAMALGVAGSAIAEQQALASRKSDAFSRWADYATMVAEWQEFIEQSANNKTEALIESGVSTEEGLLGHFKDGKYLYDVQQKSTTDIEEVLTKVLTARMINHILLMKKAFVVVDGDKCDQGGPDGAFKIEDGWLSYCTKEGSMRNIIYNNDGKSGNTFYNHEAIVRKYNMSVQYITQQSIDCQKKYGGFSHDPYANGTFPESLDSDCVCNIPVCYVSENKKIRKAKRKGNTVKACRDVAKLPL